MSVLPVETRGVVFLNAVMLFLVSIEPYLLSLLTFGSYQESRAAILNFSSVAYALDLAGLDLIMGLFTHQLTIEERKLVGSELLGTYRRNRNMLYVAAALFAVSTLPPFWSWEIVGTPARYYLWYGILVFMWMNRISVNARKLEA
jgi:hypothetical protein